MASLVNKVEQLAVNRKKKQPKRTPMADAGAILGRKVGGYFGVSQLGNSIGRWLGSGIGMITGTGDYQVTGPTPTYNVLNGQIPKFDSTRQTNVVCHREYLGDINGTAAFTNNTYPLNPGMASTFPWLSSVAANYQQYKFHGLIFEFRPLITDFVTNGAPGVVVMATNYNSDETAYVSRQEMENSEYAVSVKPTNNLVHMVECATPQTQLPIKNVRTTPVPTGQDLRVYDQGLFQFATQANPTQDLGELWVSYCVEFFKPVLSLENLLVPAQSFKAVRTGIATATPLGTGNSLISNGNLNVTITSSTLTITNLIIGTAYQINCCYTSSLTATCNVSSPTSFGSGGNALVWMSKNGSQDVNISFNSTGTASNAASYTGFFTATATSTVITFDTSFGVYAGGSASLDIIVLSVSPTVTQ